MSDLALEAFRAELAAARKTRKSDEIVDFIRHNWQLFCSSKKVVENMVEELEQHGALTPTDLADAIGIDDRIVFKKLKIADSAKVVLKMQKSSLYKTFMAVKDKFKNGLCLIAVAGEHSLVITDMATVEPIGAVVLKVKINELEEVNVFPFSDALIRMPELFTHEE